jgi:hypothetical protein
MKLKLLLRLLHGYFSVDNKIISLDNCLFSGEYCPTATNLLFICPSNFIHFTFRTLT